MDHSMYEDLDFTPPNELPQESKLATYMNRSATTPTRSQTLHGQLPHGPGLLGLVPHGQSPRGQAPIGQPPHGQALIGQGHIGQAHLGQGLTQAQLSQAQLSQAQLSQAQLSQAQLSQAQLNQLSQAQLSQAQLSQAPLSQAHLNQLSQAHLSQLSQAQLSHLSQAQLSQLSQAQLSQLSQAQLSQLSQAQLSQLSQAQLSQLSQAQLSQLSQAQLSQLSQTQLSQAQLSQAQMSQAQMSQAQLSQAQMSQAQLSQSQMSQSQMSQSQMSQSQMSQAQLSQAQMSQAQLSQAQLSQAQMSQAQLSQAQLSRAMGNLSLDGSGPTTINKALLSHPPPAQIMERIPPPPLYQQVIIGEYVPINYYSPPPMMQESAESLNQMVMAPVVTQPQVHQENVGGTTYFYTNEGVNASAMGPEPCLGVASASNYVQQMYAAPHLPPHLPPRLPAVQTRPGMSAPYYSRTDTAKKEVYQRNEDVYYMTSSRPQYTEMPEIVGKYGELSPLDGEHQQRTAFLATHRETGRKYALRRVPLATAPALPARLEAWAQLDHPNMVRFHNAFVTNAFGDESVVMVFDYHPACVTLRKKYIMNNSSALIAEANARYQDPFSTDPDAPRPYTHQKHTQRSEHSDLLIAEKDLWPIFIQITAALREIHSAGLACRHLDASKVVQTGSRYRISWSGIGEFLDEVHHVEAQQEDYTALGHLALSLVCRTMDLENLDACLEYMKRNYSKDFSNFTMYLLSSTIRSITDLMPMIGGRFYNKVEALERRADALEEQLARELDNGRHLRTLVKLGSVNERPELNLDMAWAETGNRYLLKLFRDYLFHSVTPDGRPWLDQGHLAHALNNLDSGTHTKVVLMSRDEQSILVVTFAELKHCLEQAFEELLQAAATSP